MKSKINMLREFSIPLIAGVVLALLWANLSPKGYHDFIELPMIAGLSFHFITNELFMVLFFGLLRLRLPRVVCLAAV